MEINIFFVIKVIVLVTIFWGLLIFALKKVLFDTTEGAKNRLDRETQAVRAKQAELNEKIKQANEELEKRRSEADELVKKMTEEAETKAMEEREKIMKKAREDGEDIISKAQKTKEDMRKVIEKEMEMKTVDFSVVILNEIFSEKSRSAFNTCLVADFLESLESVDMEMIDGKVDTADIVVAMPLEDKFKSKLGEILKKKLNREITVNVTEDKSIIGGVVLRFASLSLDGSLQGMIKDTGGILKEKVEKGLL